MLRQIIEAYRDTSLWTENSNTEIAVFFGPGTQELVVLGQQ